jgi:hypothetical protein
MHSSIGQCQKALPRRLPISNKPKILLRKLCRPLQATHMRKLLRVERRWEGAIPEFEIAFATNRNNPFAVVELSMCKFLTGRLRQEAVALTRQAIRTGDLCYRSGRRAYQGSRSLAGLSGPVLAFLA